MTVCVRTDRFGQKCRPRSEEQSDQGVHCLLFSLHLLDSLFYGIITAIFRVSKILKFYGILFSLSNVFFGLLLGT